jgi:hypothetical protein
MPLRGHEKERMWVSGKERDWTGRLRALAVGCGYDVISKKFGCEEPNMAENPPIHTLTCIKPVDCIRCDGVA